MVLSELLGALGVTGSIALLVSALVGVWHLRSIMQVLSRVRIWVMAGALFVVLLLAGASGFVPGLDPNLGALAGWLLGLLTDGYELAWDLATSWL